MFSFFSVAHAADIAPQITTASPTWSQFYPYRAEPNQYQLELGGFQQNHGMYWVGISYGRELGRCFGAFAEYCRQYADVNLGFANSYVGTDTLGLLGWRWQFISPTHAYSPFVRIFAGVADEQDNVRDGFVGTGGLALGVVAMIHPRFDVSFEARAAESDRFWSLALVSFSVHLDRVVTKTVEATGDLIKSTISAPKTFVDWFNKDTAPADEPKK